MKILKLNRSDLMNIEYSQGKFYKIFPGDNIIEDPDAIKMFETDESFPPMFKMKILEWVGEHQTDQDELIDTNEITKRIDSELKTLIAQETEDLIKSEVKRLFDLKVKKQITSDVKNLIASAIDEAIDESDEERDDEPKKTIKPPAK